MSVCIITIKRWGAYPAPCILFIVLDNKEYAKYIAFYKMGLF